MVSRTTLLFATLFTFSILFGINAQTTGCGLPGYGLSAVSFDGVPPYPYVLLDSTVATPYLYDTWYNFTIQTWVLLQPGATNVRPIAVKATRTNNGDNTYSNGLSNTQEFSLDVTGTNNLRFRMGCDLTYGFDVQTTATLPYGSWVNVAVVMNYQDATAVLYINGQRQTLSTGGTVGAWSSSCKALNPGLTGPYRQSYYPGGDLVPRVSNGVIQLGLYSVLYAETPYYYLGLMDEFSVWNRTLSDVEVSLNAGAGLRGDEPGLVSHTSFNEGSGTVAFSPFPSSGPYRYAPASVEEIPGYLLNNVQWTGSGIILNYPLIGLPYVPNQATAVPLYGIESPNRTVTTIYYNITSLPSHGYLTGYPLINPRGVAGTTSTVALTIQLYDIIEAEPGQTYPVVQYHPNTNFFGIDQFSFTTYALETGTGFVSCSPGGPNSGAVVYLNSGCSFLDACGICDGNNSTCKNNSTNPNPPIYVNGTCCIDECGIPGGDGSSCAGCDGIPHSGTTYDECGVCGGNNSRCADCNGIPNGPNPPNDCGCCVRPNGTYTCPNGRSEPSYCLDCNGCPFGTAVLDICGVCGGDNTSCLGCDGSPNTPTADLCGACPPSFNIDSTCGSSDPTCGNIPNVFPDACGVCGGDNSTCQCVFYKNYQIAKMDCVLIEFTLNHTLCIINELLAELQLSLANWDSFAGNSTAPFNHLVQGELLALNQFIGSSNSAESGCVNAFCSQLSSAITTISQFVQY